MYLMKIGPSVYVKYGEFEYVACFCEGDESESIQPLNRFIIEPIHHRTDSSVNRFRLFEMILH